MARICIGFSQKSKTKVAQGRIEHAHAHFEQPPGNHGEDDRLHRVHAGKGDGEPDRTVEQLAPEVGEGRAQAEPPPVEFLSQPQEGEDVLEFPDDERHQRGQRETKRQAEDLIVRGVQGEHRRGRHGVREQVEPQEEGGAQEAHADETSGRLSAVHLSHHVGDEEDEGKGEDRG